MCPKIQYNGCRKIFGATCGSTFAKEKAQYFHLHPSNIAATREPIIRQNQTKGFPEIKHLAASICQLTEFTLHAPSGTS